MNKWTRWNAKICSARRWRSMFPWKAWTKPRRPFSMPPFSRSPKKSCLRLLYQTIKQIDKIRIIRFAPHRFDGLKIFLTKRFLLKQGLTERFLVGLHEQKIAQESSHPSISIAKRVNDDQRGRVGSKRSEAECSPPKPPGL